MAYEIARPEAEIPLIKRDDRSCSEATNMTYDYHRAMTDTVVEAPAIPCERLVWIMNDTHCTKYLAFLHNEMGVEPDNDESFGIPIEMGEPSDGQPFELVVRPAH